MDEKGGSIALIKSGNEILLDLRKVKGGSMWEIPGGGIEAGEKPEEAVYREVREEVSISIKTPVHLGIKNQAIHGRPTQIDHFFLINSFSGEPKAYDPVDRETLSVRWIKINRIKNLLNVSWRVVDAMRFLSIRIPALRNDYTQIRSAFDNRPVYSFENLAYSFRSNMPFLKYKDYLDKKSIGQVNGMLDGLKPPVLQINPGYGAVTKELISRFGRIDAVELSPTARNVVREKFGENLNFIDGIPEMFKPDKKYNTVIAINSYIYQPSYILFIKNLSSSINRNGSLIFSPLEPKYHILPSKYISYRHAVRSIESYLEFFSAFGFNTEKRQRLKLDRLNNINTNVLLLRR